MARAGGHVHIGFGSTLRSKKIGRHAATPRARVPQSSLAAAIVANSEHISLAKPSQGRNAALVERSATDTALVDVAVRSAADTPSTQDPKTEHGAIPNALFPNLPAAGSTPTRSR